MKEGMIESINPIDMVMITQDINIRKMIEEIEKEIDQIVEKKIDIEIIKEVNIMIRYTFNFLKIDKLTILFLY